MKRKFAVFFFLAAVSQLAIVGYSSFAVTGSIFSSGFWRFIPVVLAISFVTSFISVKLFKKNNAYSVIFCVFLSLILNLILSMH